ncbi:uncharacterized protein [Ptychodera flava]|uniref:uncharacterized protein n=1 Tax=Ptychodera flava TaxID=63121 RepID=UPI00396A048D
MSNLVDRYVDNITIDVDSDGSDTSNHVEFHIANMRMNQSDVSNLDTLGKRLSSAFAEGKLVSRLLGAILGDDTLYLGGGNNNVIPHRLAIRSVEEPDNDSMSQSVKMNSTNSKDVILKESGRTNNEKLTVDESNSSIPLEDEDDDDDDDDEMSLSETGKANDTTVKLESDGDDYSNSVSLEKSNKKPTESTSRLGVGPEAFGSQLLDENEKGKRKVPMKSDLFVEYGDETLNHSDSGLIAVPQEFLDKRKEYHVKSGTEESEKLSGGRQKSANESKATSTSKGGEDALMDDSYRNVTSSLVAKIIPGDKEVKFSDSPSENVAMEAMFNLADVIGEDETVDNLLGDFKKMVANGEESVDLFPDIESPETRLSEPRAVSSAPVETDQPISGGVLIRRLLGNSADEHDSVKRNTAAYCIKENLIMALVTHQTQHINMPCDPCSRSSEHVHWFKEIVDDVGSREVEIAFDFHDDEEDNRVVLTETMSMQIRRSSPEDAGIYRCRAIKDGKILGMYNVEVKEESDVHEVFLTEPETPLTDETKEGVRLYTKWSEWSDCSKCGEEGERVRMGYCFAEVLLDQYAYGLPCSSTKLSDRHRKIFVHRKDEKMIDICHEPCDNTDDGTSLPKMESSIDHTVPLGKLQTKIVRRVFGESVRLQCPGGSMTTPITWMNGTKTLKSSELHRGQSRMKIDVMNVLHIRDLVRFDSGSYTCWIKGRKVADFRLKVTKPLVNKGAWQYFGYLFIYFIILTTVFIVVMVIRHRYSRKHLSQ